MKNKIRAQSVRGFCHVKLSWGASKGKRGKYDLSPRHRTLLLDNLDDGVIVDVPFAVKIEHNGTVLVVVNINFPLIGGDEVAVMTVYVHDPLQPAVHIRIAAFELAVAGGATGKDEQRDKQAKNRYDTKKMFHHSHPRCSLYLTLSSVELLVFTFGMRLFVCAPPILAAHGDML